MMNHVLIGPYTIDVGPMGESNRDESNRDLLVGLDHDLDRDSVHL